MPAGALRSGYQCERLQPELPFCAASRSPLIGTQRGTGNCSPGPASAQTAAVQIDQGEAGGETGPVVLPVQLALLQDKGVKRELQCRGRLALVLRRWLARRLAPY